jgi:uncharacterized protein
MTSQQASTNLCLECGLCCNGALFRDVELQSGDDVPGLIRLGLSIKISQHTKKQTHKLLQPCSALCENLHCRIYTRRPARCREFECAILQKVIAGTLPLNKALMKVHRVRAQIRSIERLLNKLGDQHSDLPLKKRFQKTQLRLEKNGCDPEAADTFAKLSESYHALGMQLVTHFYSAPYQSIPPQLQ